MYARLDRDLEAAFGPVGRVEIAQPFLPGLELQFGPHRQLADAERAVGAGDGRIGVVAGQDVAAFPGMVIAVDVTGMFCLRLNLYLPSPFTGSTMLQGASPGGSKAMFWATGSELIV